MPTNIDTLICSDPEASLLMYRGVITRPLAQASYEVRGVEAHIAKYLNHRLTERLPGIGCSTFILKPDLSGSAALQSWSVNQEAEPRYRTVVQAARVHPLDQATDLRGYFASITSVFYQIQEPLSLEQCIEGLGFLGTLLPHCREGTEDRCLRSLGLRFARAYGSR